MSETSIDPEPNKDADDFNPAEISGFDPFPKPRLFPEHWDLSGLLEQAPAKPKVEIPDWHEPFPKLRTFPDGWNLA